MSGLSTVYMIWLVLTATVISVGFGIGVWKILRERKPVLAGDPALRHRPLEIVVPVTGHFPGQELILTTLLEQTYPTYDVIFVVESESDAASPVVDSLCTSHARARKVISGLASAGAQKNHNLIAGVRVLKPDTEIIVFCDSSNAADRGWLERFVGPLLTCEAKVVTTFRTFRASPETVGGVSQIMYGAFLRILAMIRPKPWGGATAIRRDIFHRLNVVDAWAKTVVDDLVLGNLLEEAGISVRMDPFNLLTSPLTRQSVLGFLQYLDRQILFPRFTNPGMWITTVVGVTNLGMTTLAALLVSILFALDMVPTAVGRVSIAFLGCLATNLAVVHKIDASPISLRKWLWTFVPFIACGSFLCVRSIFRNYIDWHGRRYRAGRKGIVLHVTRVP